MRNAPIKGMAKSGGQAGGHSNARAVDLVKDRKDADPLASSGKSTNRQVLWILVGFAGSLLLRASVLDFRSGDYTAFLSNWYDYFVEHGRWAALKDNFTGYPVLYLELISLSTLLPLPKLYAIKLLSILGDYVAAWFAFKVVQSKFQTGPMSIAAALLVLYLPTVWLNSAVWGQCDVMHTGALLAALHFVIRKRPVAAMVAFGFACASKPQGILLAPFLGGVFFRERWNWKYLAVPPLVYAACGLPAMLAGRPVLDVVLRWARHTNYPELTMGATNWYQLVSNEYHEFFFLSGVVLAVVATVSLILVMQKPTSTERGTWLVSTALLSVLLVPYFLPGMHERYFYASDVFSLIYAFFIPNGWIVAVLVQFCSFFTYLPYLFKQEPVPRPFLALVMTFAIALVAVDFIKRQLANILKEAS